MRLFGFFIIRWARLQEMHRHRRSLADRIEVLQADNTALRAAMVFQQNQIHDLLAELSLYTGHLQEQREENHA